MPPSHLPFEIVEKILTHLVRKPLVYNARNPDLLSCSLVSRTWLGAAREHMWDGDWFGIPQAECQFTALKLLCASPLYSLRLDKVANICADLCDPWITSFFEWCSPFFTGVTRIEIGDQSFAPGSATLPKGIFAGFPALKFLSIYRMHFASTNDFYDLLLSLKELEHLSCREVFLENKKTEESDELLIKSSIRRLDVDFDSFFALFYRRVTFTGLQELYFEEPYGNSLHGTQQHHYNDHRWRGIGDILAYTGHRLVKLTLVLLRKLDFSTFIQTSMDLPTKTPILRELEIQIGVLANVDKLLLPMISFRRPHQQLSSLKIYGLPDNLREFDSILERSTPRLQELKFFAFSVSQEYMSDDASWPWGMTLDHLQCGSEDWRKARKYMVKVGGMMPWCEKQQCLVPVFTLRG
ncbi:hypothetical protein Moror_9327 [Moniliophthora roreri MCA 2997]|uniref:F-box domain-containing protein n=1 Tax=Moniliophthora roreri (strain MCA 2997) TaxID=1381753 RepID=V2WGZ5_MONRO|nr:hypothetical protein Moror_9327 [Moniliophthora roreri MCA 2997]